MDFEKVRENAAELRELRFRIRRISDEITKEIMKSKDIREGLNSGILKLGFPAPPNFYQTLRRTIHLK